MHLLERRIHLLERRIKDGALNGCLVLGWYAVAEYALLTFSLVFKPMLRGHPWESMLEQQWRGTVAYSSATGLLGWLPE
ncbi:MAG TPA: hypothetical protein VKB88_41225 [Bryobacteraceae bacterium]|nr:hypothetical protein [Bryobacteraceae bacterium]